MSQATVGEAFYETGGYFFYGWILYDKNRFIIDNFLALEGDELTGKIYKLVTIVQAASNPVTIQLQRWYRSDEIAGKIGYLAPRELVESNNYREIKLDQLVGVKRIWALSRRSYIVLTTFTSNTYFYNSPAVYWVNCVSERESPKISVSEKPPNLDSKWRSMIPTEEMTKMRTHVEHDIREISTKPLVATNDSKKLIKTENHSNSESINHIAHSSTSFEGIDTIDSVPDPIKIPDDPETDEIEKSESPKSFSRSRYLSPTPQLSIKPLPSRHFTHSDHDQVLSQDSDSWMVKSEKNAEKGTPKGKQTLIEPEPNDALSDAMRRADVALAASKLRNYDMFLQEDETVGLNPTGTNDNHFVIDDDDENIIQVTKVTPKPHFTKLSERQSRIANLDSDDDDAGERPSSDKPKSKKSIPSLTIDGVPPLAKPTKNAFNELMDKSRKSSNGNPKTPKNKKRKKSEDNSTQSLLDGFGIKTPTLQSLPTIPLPKSASKASKSISDSDTDDLDSDRASKKQKLHESDSIDMDIDGPSENGSGMEHSKHILGHRDQPIPNKPNDDGETGDESDDGSDLEGFVVGDDEVTYYERERFFDEGTPPGARSSKKKGFGSSLKSKPSIKTPEKSNKPQTDLNGELGDLIELDSSSSEDEAEFRRDSQDFHDLTSPISTTIDLETAFMRYLQYLISSIIDKTFAPSFIGPTSQPDDYFWPAIHKIKDKLFILKNSLISSSVWSHELLQSIESLPELAKQKDDAVNDKQCKACGRQHAAVFLVTIHGIPYESAGFWDGQWEGNVPSDDSNEEAQKVEIPAGPTCAKRMQLYHRLHHYQLKLVKSITPRVDKVRACHSDEEILDLVIGDQHWMRESYRAFNTLTEEITQYGMSGKGKASEEEF